MATTFEAADLPHTVKWYILDVCRKGGKTPDRREWCALLADVDPGQRGEHVRRIKREAWLNLGRYKSREDAWERAEDLLETRH